MKKLIYLDNAATTKTAPEVVEAMLPYFTEFYGNPSSVYEFSGHSKEAIAKSRETIAKALEEGTRKVVEEVSEFVNREDVQQTITKARTKATELMNRGAESLKDLFGKKDGQK